MQRAMAEARMLVTPSHVVIKVPRTCYYMCAHTVHTTAYVLIQLCVLIPLYIGPHTSLYASPID